MARWDFLVAGRLLAGWRHCRFRLIVVVLAAAAAAAVGALGDLGPRLLEHEHSIRRLWRLAGRKYVCHSVASRRLELHLTRPQPRLRLAGRLAR